MDDITRFTEGDCWILAKRLHKLTGWPLKAFGSRMPDTHAFVVRPDGKCLDVQGVCSLRTMCKRYGYSSSDVGTFSSSALNVFELEFGHYSYERARKVAAQLLDQHGLEC